MIESLRSIVQKKKERFQAQYRPFTTYKAPEVYCPKEKRKVPIWYCLGSYMQRRFPCPELLEATVRIAEGYADVKCKAQRSTEKEEKVARGEENERNKKEDDGNNVYDSDSGKRDTQHGAG